MVDLSRREFVNKICLLVGAGSLPFSRAALAFEPKGGPDFELEGVSLRSRRIAFVGVVQGGAYSVAQFFRRELIAGGHKVNIYSDHISGKCLGSECVDGVNQYLSALPKTQDHFEILLMRSPYSFSQVSKLKALGFQVIAVMPQNLVTGFEEFCAVSASQVWIGNEENFYFGRRPKSVELPRPRDYFNYYKKSLLNISSVKKSAGVQHIFWNPAVFKKISKRSREPGFLCEPQFLANPLNCLTNEKEVALFKEIVSRFSV
jgi:hypothetical protein